MKSDYARTRLLISVFDAEDVIATSGVSPEPTEPTEPTKILKKEIENRYGTFDQFDLKPPTGSWF